MVSEDDNAEDAHLSRLLDYVFQSMVLLYGLDDLTNIKNIERFKREIKVNKYIFHIVYSHLFKWIPGPWNVSWDQEHEKNKHKYNEWACGWWWNLGVRSKQMVWPDLQAGSPSDIGQG